MSVQREARGEDPTEYENLLLTDRPFNTRQERNRDNYAHDVHSNDNMKQLAEVIEDVLTRSGHGFIFCSG